MYNGVLFSLKSERHTCNVDELWGHNALWNKPVKKGQILWFHLVLKFIKIGKGMVAAREEERGEWRVIA